MRENSRVFVHISISAQKTMLLDVHKRQFIEACGVLLGRRDDDGNWFIEQAYPLRNIFDSPVYFEFAPEDLLAVDSSTDRQNMKRVNVEQQIPWIWLIISGPFDRNPTLLQQVQRHLRLLPDSSFVAYHHYEGEGLRRIPIHFEEVTEKPFDDIP